MIIPDGRADASFVNVFVKQPPKRTGSMTPADLIEMLKRWDQNQQFEVAIVNTPESNHMEGEFKVEKPYAAIGGRGVGIILRQGLNSINLSGKD